MFDIGKYKLNLKYLHEERVMNNGQQAKIIAYRGCRDIDVQFEDNTIVTHKSYQSFRQGSIRNPNIVAPQKQMSKRGEVRKQEVRVMNNGQQAKIINYRSATDIDVQFEDGTIVYHREYGRYKRGHIANPNLHASRKDEQRRMNNGQMATIIAYRSAGDIDVQFEDKTIVTNKCYASFQKGCIRNPNIVVRRPYKNK